ncbi:lysozyme [Flavivirga aquatica]|uniref:Lysozyme n=1 Tax=Flavivirga aquatica TaxID=1849968 RepID=A0A1E5TEN6_9FLAO|nr:GPW/gp25 family protein [Flavivirga aquatica]OEK09824.1 lysozyme [Flavivirga aquatica]
MKYIKLPINFSSLIKGKDSSSCSLEESIAQSIMMQITSRYGEVAGRPDFGSDIWELEFNQLVKVYEWEEDVKQSLLKTINLYEKRLYDVDVTVNLSEFEKESSLRRRRDIRRKADIFVTGKIIYQDLPFHFNTVLYISPLSQ